MSSTNYYDTFIEVAEDCKATAGEVPPERKSGKTVAKLEYEIIATNPYKYTSDEVIFSVYATRNNIPAKRFSAEREKYFSKGRPCFRASPLTKTYGWGLHCDAQGKVALVGVETADYKKFHKDKSITKTRAMRSKK